MARLASPSSNVTTTQDITEAFDAFFGRGTVLPPRPIGASPEEQLTKAVDDFFLRGGESVEISEEDTPNLLRTLGGRIAEFVISAGRGAIALPAGAERLTAGAIEAAFGVNVPEPLNAIQQGTVDAQEAALEIFGLQDVNALNTILGEIFGGVATGLGELKLIGMSGPMLMKLLGKGFGSNVFRTINLNQAILANRASRTLGRAAFVGGESALFELGLPGVEGIERNVPLALALGTVFGAGLGGLAARKGSKIRLRFGIPPEMPEEIVEGIIRGEIDTPAKFSAFLAALDSQDQLLKSVSKLEQAIDDQTLTAIALSLQEAGEKGAVGSIRAVDLTADAIDNLRNAFPRYRFETIDDPNLGKTLLYGLQPKLREGRSFGYLTDKAIEFYRRHGFMLGQRALVSGNEVEVAGLAGRQLKIRIPEGSGLLPINAENVLFLDDVPTRFGSEDLFQRFLVFRRGFDNWEEAFDAFVVSLPDFDTSLRSSLRSFFTAQEAKTINLRISPDAAHDLNQFHKARAKYLQEGPAEGDLDIAAASRNFMVTKLSQGRVKLTNVADGQSRLFRSQSRAIDYLSKFSMNNTPDLSPSIGELPGEILRGTVQGTRPANPSLPPQFEARGMASAMQAGKVGFFDRVLKGTRRFAQGAEARGQQIEQFVGEPIWTQGMQGVSLGATKAMNRSFPFLERLRLISTKVKPKRRPVIRGWMESELKDTFAAANSMTKKEIEAARALRTLYNDAFDALSKSAGVDLSADDFLRNYAPDIQEYIFSTGSVEGFEQIWMKTGRPLPQEVQFFAEAFKAGEILEVEDIFVATARYIRSGFFKSEAGQAFEQAVQFTKTVKDPDAQQFLADYLLTIRGYPTLGREELVKVAQEFFGSIGIKDATAKQIGTVVDDLWLANAGALIAWRPGLVFRNMTQNIQLLAPLMRNGFRRVFRAMATADREYAEAIGALRKQTPITRAEIAEVLPGAVGTARTQLRRVSRAGLRFYANADEWNRAVTATAVRNAFNDALPKYRAGKITFDQLERFLGMQVQDAPVRAEFLRLFSDESPTAARDFAAREMANFTQFLYGLANSPAWVRNAFGKMFGNYSTFPFGYFNWITRAAAQPKTSDVISTFAKHGTVNMALLSLGGLGVNMLSWMPMTSLGYTGGPFLDAAKDLHTVANGIGVKARGADPGPDYNLALANLPRHMRLVIPGSMLVSHDFRRASERVSQNEIVFGILEAIGFRTRQAEQGFAVGVR